MVRCRPRNVLEMSQGELSTSGIALVMVQTAALPCKTGQGCRQSEPDLNIIYKAVFKKEIGYVLQIANALGNHADASLS